MRRHSYSVSGFARISIALALSSAGCARDSPPPDTSAAPSGEDPAPPVVAADRRAVLAPIDAAELLVRESAPPQYALRVLSGLPSGCAKFERTDVKRDGYVLDVRVWNTLPAADTPCTMIYGTVEHVVELGAGFAPGERFAVHVNGEPRVDFTAQ